MNPTERDYDLGFLIDQPHLLDAAEIPTDFFRTDYQRTVWAVVCELRAADDPIQFITVAERCRENGALAYLTSITSGLIPLKPQDFKRRILKHRAEDTKKRMQSLASKDLPDLDEIASLGEEARRLELEAEGEVGGEPLSRSLSDVEPREVPWLWQDFIPLGRATLISGDPGSAKTFFCLGLASRLSRGLPWPDGSPGSGPARTYYLTVEDDLADTIRPRVDSLGGDPAMIAAYNSEHSLHLDLSNPDGIQRLETELVRLGNVRLVVVDPIIDFSGSVNPNAGEEVRALLTPLIRLASKLNFALVLVGHLNKAQALSAIYRAGGTTSGWLGKCRAAFMIFRDADDKALRRVTPIKANNARQDPPQLEFRLLDGQLHVEVSTEEVDVDAQLNPQQRGPKPHERDEAARWLREFFAGRDEIPSTEVEEAAQENLISPATLRRAKKAGGFVSRKRSESGGRVAWVWARGSTCSDP